jgi:hypothetical protein
MTERQKLNILGYLAAPDDRQHCETSLVII